MTEHYDIAVIGAGPGGYVAALKAAQMGARTAIVEMSSLGGSCLNYGCIPSKALLASAELMHHVAHAAELGVQLPGPAQVDWPRVQQRKDGILQTLRGGIASLLKGRKVTLYLGRATLTGPGKVTAEIYNGPPQQFTAKNVILAVGSVPSRIPGWPDDRERVCTSDEALHWDTLPKRLLIVGGGVIGCEFACMMQPLGVEVTVVEMLPRLLPNMDCELGESIAKILTKRGIKVFTSTKVEDLKVADGVSAVLSNGQKIDADRVLVATGRKPNTANLGLETVGLTTDRGFVRADERMATPVAGHWCIGDANGRCLLAHAASAQGEVAVENALGHQAVYDMPIPEAVYTFPEAASVGMNSQRLAEAGIPVAVGKFPFAYLGKAMAAGDTNGFVKVYRHRGTGELLGVQMLGHNVTECIAAATGLLGQKVSVADVAHTVAAHPTMGEGLKEAAEDALGQAIHLPPRKILRAKA